MIYAINKRTKEHRVVPRLDVYSNHDWRYVEADDDGWIPWEGGECPLPDGTHCEYKMRPAGRAKTVRGSEYLDWSHEGGSAEIVAYRPILNAEPSEPEAPEWAIGERCIWQLGDVCMGEHVILAKDGDTYWIRDDHGGYDMADREELRPLHSEEDKAVEELLDEKAVSSDEGVTPNYYAKWYKGVKLDPYRIAQLYEIGGGPQEQVLKKALRGCHKGHEELQVIKEIRQALDRWEEMLEEDSLAANQRDTEEK